MAKILCKCGQIIVDQNDFIKNKAYIIADQDYFDLLDEIEKKNRRMWHKSPLNISVVKCFSAITVTIS